MTLDELRSHLDKMSLSLKDNDETVLRARLSSLVSSFPFNEYEFILMFLRDKGILTFEDYELLRTNYVSANKYLNLFELAPRIFGQIWGEEHIRDLDGRFRKASKQLDPNYDGDYDLWIDGVKVELKACRAYDEKKSGSLVSKALRYDSGRPFWMNFQQLKPEICDVLIFVGVWTDRIMYWVLDSTEARNSPYISHQHRGGVEYQIGITERNIKNFDRFSVESSQVGNKVVEKGKPKS
jgi:hypothetical protein